MNCSWRRRWSRWPFLLIIVHLRLGTHPNYPRLVLVLLSFPSSYFTSLTLCLHINAISLTHCLYALWRCSHEFSRSLACSRYLMHALLEDMRVCFFCYSDLLRSTHICHFPSNFSPQHVGFLCHRSHIPLWQSPCSTPCGLYVPAMVGPWPPCSPPKVRFILY